MLEKRIDLHFAMRLISSDLIYSLIPASGDTENLVNSEKVLSGNQEIAKPLENGTLVIKDDGTILEVLDYRPEGDQVEIWEGILCPGFINAHTHLELSHLLGQIPERTGLVEFILQIQKLRKSDPESIQESIKRAYFSLYQEGILGFGDISNGSDSFAVKEKGSIYSHTFLECFSFLPARAESALESGMALKKLAQAGNLSSSLSPHAPYSVSEKLFSLIKENEPGLQSIHNQESKAENEFYQTGEGDFKKLYESFGLDISFYKPFQKPSLETYLPWMGHQKKLLVHNTFTTKEEMAWAKEFGVTWCLCPGANLYIEGVLPNLSILKEFYPDMVLGTDSLASNHALSILREMKIIHQNFPDISLNQILVWACKNGAAFFDWENLGSFEKGKKPGILNLRNKGNPLTFDDQTFLQRIL